MNIFIKPTSKENGRNDMNHKTSFGNKQKQKQKQPKLNSVYKRNNNNNNQTSKYVDNRPERDRI